MVLQLNGVPCYNSFQSYYFAFLKLLPLWLVLVALFNYSVYSQFNGYWSKWFLPQSNFPCEDISNAIFEIIWLRFKYNIITEFEKATNCLLSHTNGRKINTSGWLFEYSMSHSIHKIAEISLQIKEKLFFHRTMGNARSNYSIRWRGFTKETIKWTITRNAIWREANPLILRRHTFSKPQFSSRNLIQIQEQLQSQR